MKQSSLSESNLQYDPSHIIRHIHVEESCLDLPYAKEILKNSGLNFDVVSEKEGLIPVSKNPVDFTEAKKHLYLCRNRGRFFKPCPGTGEYHCCGYNILNVGMNCPMDCVYCILQAYLNNPMLTHFVNIEDLFQEMEQLFEKNPEKFYRIGTGEFTDSLALDRLTLLSGKLVEYFSTKKQAVLELKTKSASVENLEGIHHAGRTIVAWSVNAPEIVKREEIRSASLQQRLAAAKKCAQWGYKLAFHFDPIIEHPHWKEGYAETIKQIFTTVPRESIVWISLGALRYLPQLKSIATKRFSGSRIFYQEFVEGLDGKSRYFRSHRTELYKHIYDLLKQFASGDTCIYFCMESDEIWRDVMGFIPHERGGVAQMLDRVVFERK
jgi:DNA repair photolyase